MTANEAIEVARKHMNNGAAMQSSAVLCVSEAEERLAEGRPELAIGWAKRSLKYSCGIFSPDYQAL